MGPAHQRALHKARQCLPSTGPLGLQPRCKQELAGGAGAGGSAARTRGYTWLRSAADTFRSAQTGFKKGSCCCSAGAVLVFPLPRLASCQLAHQAVSTSIAAKQAPGSFMACHQIGDSERADCGAVF